MSAQAVRNAHALTRIEFIRHGNGVVEPTGPSLDALRTQRWVECDGDVYKIILRMQDPDEYIFLARISAAPHAADEPDPHDCRVLHIAGCKGRPLQVCLDSAGSFADLMLVVQERVLRDASMI